MKSNAGIKTGTIVGSVVAGCLLAAACGNMPAPVVPPPHHLTAAQHVTAGRTLAGNRELAKQRAAWLLSHVRLPSGAVPLSSAPRSLSGPAMGRPGATTLVDTVRFWRVRMPFAAMTAWLREHRQRLPETGSSSGSERGRLLMTGFDYGQRVGSALQSAELEISVAPAGQKASVIRADGVVVYLDPRPAPDNEKGPRLRVTLAGGCPRSDTGIVGVRNSGPGLRHRLVPAGKPAAGLVCRYNGLNGKAFALRTATRLDAAQARRLARSMARLAISHVDGGWHSCPMDDGSAEVIVLSYRHGSQIDLWYKLNGCRYAGNGFITAGF